MLIYQRVGHAYSFLVKMHGVHPISAKAVEWFYGSHIPGGPDHGNWLVWMAPQGVKHPQNLH